MVPEAHTETPLLFWEWRARNVEWIKTKGTSCLELLISDKFVDNTFASISPLHALLNTFMPHFMPTFHAKCTMWKSEGAQNGQYRPHGTTPFKRLCSMPGLPKWSNGWPRVMPRTMVLWNGDALPQSCAFFYLAFAILAIFRRFLGSWIWLYPGWCHGWLAPCSALHTSRASGFPLPRPIARCETRKIREK